MKLFKWFSLSVILIGSFVTVPIIATSKLIKNHELSNNQNPQGITQQLETSISQVKEKINTLKEKTESLTRQYQDNKAKINEFDQSLTQLKTQRDSLKQTLEKLEQENLVKIELY
ncbi:hypothetical protein NX779_02110 [Mycoplasma cottewii]|uniref:Uncharacterized protein n=1 Tax=Mycoplasma cottewii TaxID=51364 RepID=A0ABY5U294_9MOLU|nr:hypothetical protein [Mycoplasma cottewii]UWD35409.1 hypothetical protein NX779_02110 [Mycoplasma cottewii]